MAEIISLLSDSEGDDIDPIQRPNKRSFNDVIDITSDDSDSFVFKGPKIRHSDLDAFSEEELSVTKFGYQKGNIVLMTSATTSSRLNRTTVLSYGSEQGSDNELSHCKNGGISSNFPKQTIHEMPRRISTSSSNIDLVSLHQLPSDNDGKRLPDLRDWFIYTLLLHAQNLNIDSYTKPTYDSVIKAVFRIAIYQHPVRSIESCVRQVDSCGIVIRDILKAAYEVSTEESRRDLSVPLYKFLCTAAAALVCLLEHSSSTLSPSTPAPERAWLSLEELLGRVNAKIYTPPSYRGSRGLRNQLDLDSSAYASGTNHRSIAYDSMLQLVTAKLVKQRQRKGKSVSGIFFELLPAGKDVALLLQKQAAVMPSLGPLRQLLSTVTLRKYEGVHVAVDFREGGGERHEFHNMCDTLQAASVPFFSRSLCVGDYLFFVDSNKVAPIIVERKSLVDVANSMHDGRWEKQKAAMKRAQVLLGGGRRQCELIYLIEGKFSKVIMAEGNYVGNPRHRITKDAIEEELANLEKQGFIVSRSKSSSMAQSSVAGSTVVLSIPLLAERLKRQYDFGIYSEHNLLTYDQLRLQLSGVLPDHPGGFPEDPCDFKPSTDEDFHLSQNTSTDDASPSQGVEVFEVDDDDDDEDNNQDSGGTQLHEHHHHHHSSSEEQGAAESSIEIIPDNPTSLSREQLCSYKVKPLQLMCQRLCLKHTGTRDQLVDRILGPQMPVLLVERTRADKFVPRMPSSCSAFLIALLLYDPARKGMSKEDLMQKANQLGIKDVYEKKNGYYDGWTGNMTKMKEKELTIKVKDLWKLTERTGPEVAEAVHHWAHVCNYCKCAEQGFTYPRR